MTAGQGEGFPISTGHAHQANTQQGCGQHAPWLALPPVAAAAASGDGAGAAAVLHCAVSPTLRAAAAGLFSDRGERWGVQGLEGAGAQRGRVIARAARGSPEPYGAGL